MRPDEYVICADEKTQLQALGRRHATVAPGPRLPGLVEFDYLRGGTLAYLAAWDVHHARHFDRVEATTGIIPFARLVEQVMSVEPYASAYASSGSSTTAARTPARPRTPGCKAPMRTPA